MRIKKTLSFLFLSALAASALAPGASAASLSERLSGRILLQVEARGEAWYVNPADGRRYYLGRPADAFRIMRDLGLGVSDRDFNAWQGTAPARLKGRIVLKVEDLGQAYYVAFADNKLHYLGRPADAFALMRAQGLGISDGDISLILPAAGHEAPPALPAAPDAPPARPPLDCPAAECDGDRERSYIPEAGECTPAEDDCSDCSCACGGYGEEESAANDNCQDGKDNDCDGSADAEDGDCVAAGTAVSGRIEADTAWTSAGSPYLVSGTLEIARYKTLSIGPGVTVKIAAGAGEADLGGISLVVRGRIEAKGTAAGPVLFGAASGRKEAGSWGAIEVIDGGELDFEYVGISGATTGVSGANCANIRIVNSVIESNQTGIFISCSATAEYNEIKGNAVGAVLANGGSSPRDSGTHANYSWLAQISHNAITGNAGDSETSAGILVKDIQAGGQGFDVYYNRIESNTNGFLFDNTGFYSDLRIRNNNIAGNLDYQAKSKTIGRDIAMGDNWWGTASISEIDAVIFDYFDSAAGLAKIDYRPYKPAAVEIN